MSTKRKRPALPPVSEEMKRVSVLLRQELLEWPDTRAGLMFGLRTFYRGPSIFGMLPDQRGFETPNGIGVKKNGKWKVVEVKNEAGIATALARLRDAYNECESR